VHLLADETETFGGQALVERLPAEYPPFSWGWTPSPAEEPWFRSRRSCASRSTTCASSIRRYAEAEKLRIRNIERTPRSSGG
jgi:hypothetical protein